MKSRIAQNAIWIIVCKVVQSVLQLIISMLTARYLGPTNYGLVNYSASLVAFFTPIMQLGLNGILVQEIVNHPEREGETMGTAMLMNVASGAFCMVGLIAFASVSAAGERETILVCSLYSASMLMEAVHILQYWFQSKLLSKYTALAMLAAYVVAAVYQAILLVMGKSVYWFAVSKALDIAIIDVILLVMYKRCGGKQLEFSWAAGRSMLQRSKYYILANMMVVVFAQTDRIMLKMMIGAEATGYYSAAAACAGISSFVFSAIIDSMRPSILESKKVDSVLFRKQATMLYSIVIYLSLAQCVAICLLAPLVVHVLYGAAYEPSVDVLRIIVWYTTFSYLGAVRNVWILAEDKHHLLWRINMTGALANVALNMVMIPIWGANGAALASLITQVFTNIVLCAVVKELRPTIAIMRDSMNPQCLYTSVRKLIKR